MIIGLVDLMMQSPEVYGKKLPGKLIEIWASCNATASTLSSMIDDVLDLSQVEAGRLALHREWVDLAEIARRRAVVQPLLGRRGWLQALVADATCPRCTATAHVSAR